MQSLPRVVAVLLLVLAALRGQTSTPPVVRFHTNVGDMVVELLPDSAPKTVANFLAYMNAGSYNNSIIHRSVPGFIFQGGGYQLINGKLPPIPANAAIPNEFSVSNTADTLAMALVGSDINSATTQWFFNEVDNSSTLDSQHFTVFGRIASTDTASLKTFASIAGTPVFSFSPPFNQIPLLNYSSGPVQNADFVLVSSIEQIVVPVGAPLGNVDTPVNGTSGVAGAIGITGWAVGSPAVTSVGIWRESVVGESCAQPQNGVCLVFVGTATLVPGARPDVANAYPGYPNNNFGWGLQVLTNELPNANQQSGPAGNGTYRFHAIAVNAMGQTDIGATQIGVDNAGSVLPFGTIDTPAQGGTASGKAFVNFGWVLTPQPNSIPLDGSTISVLIDKVVVGHPVYNNYRSDVAAAFPGLQNSAGAVGYYHIDTTKLANGLHTISWVATDSAGHAAGLGSRFFNVQN